MSYHDPKLAGQVGAIQSNRSRNERLIQRHLPLVRKLAWHVHGRVSTAIDVEDLIQIGMVVLVEAAQSFEDRGFGFTNYAKLRVRGAMIDHLRKLSNISRLAMDFRKRMRTVKSKLTQELGGTPDEVAMAAALGMDQESFRIATDHARKIDLKPMDEVYADNNRWFEDKSEKADARIERNQRSQQLADAIACLPEREALTLQLHFFEEMKLEEIGQTLEVCSARISQIKKAALGNLREILANREQYF